MFLTPRFTLGLVAGISVTSLLLLQLVEVPDAAAVAVAATATQNGDINGDDRIDLSDAVSVLTWLFVGGSPPVLGAQCVLISGCGETCRN